MSWENNPISHILGRVAVKSDLIYKTVNRADYCYFSFYGVNDLYTIKCNDEGLVEIIYKPNTLKSFYMNYDSRRDTLCMYYTNRYLGNSRHSEPKEIVNFYRCRKICTEEGHFMEMTAQDLTELPMEVITKHLEVCDKILELTKRARDGKTISQI